MKKFVNDGKDTNVPSNDDWIPCSERYPNTEDYLLLSFKNFSIPLVGRYEEDEAGGAFYIGDETETCVSQGIFVNAWQQLPPNYQPKEELTEEYDKELTQADRIRAMSDEELKDFICALNDHCLGGMGLCDCSEEDKYCSEVCGIKTMEWLQSKAEEE